LATERVFSWLKLDDGAQGRQGRRYDYYQDRVSEVAPRGQNPLKGSPETQRATFFANVRLWKLLWNRNRLKGPSPLLVCPAGCLPVAGDMPHKSDRLDPSAPVFGVPQDCPLSPPELLLNLPSRFLILRRKATFLPRETHEYDQHHARERLDISTLSASGLYQNVAVPRHGLGSWTDLKHVLF
jgi:hypothetical protein